MAEHSTIVGGPAGIGPAWTRGEIEKPAGVKDHGTWKVRPKPLDPTLPLDLRVTAAITELYVGST